MYSSCVETRTRGAEREGTVMKMSVICRFAGRNMHCETHAGRHHWSIRKDATTTSDCPKTNAHKSRVNSCADFRSLLDMKTLVHVLCLTRTQLMLLSSAVCAMEALYYREASQPVSSLVVQDTMLYPKLFRAGDHT